MVFAQKFLVFILHKPKNKQQKGTLSVGVFGSTNVLYSAMDFVANPKNWLISMYKYEPIFTVAPNFGFNLLCNLPEDLRKRFPIPKHTSLVSGAEPINPKIMKRTKEIYDVTNVVPGYGLAGFQIN